MIFVASGTQDGRGLVEYLLKQNYKVMASVVTNYGKELLPKDENLIINDHKLDEEAMKNAHPDFIGFNYYSTATVQHSSADEELDSGADQQSSRGEAGYYKGYANPNLKKTEFGWEIDPFGFRATIREMYSRYRLPMIVTENGLGAYDTLEDGRVHDNYRIAYLRAHIEQLHKAVTENIEMMGYCPWSAIDSPANFFSYQVFASLTVS